jgi:photosystem II stability/assembly factor-like uncharacterized protein
MRAPSRFYFCTLLLSLVFVIPSFAQNWRHVGPPGGDVQSLAAVPGSTQVLYMGTSDGHVFGSRNGGENWLLLGRIGANHDDVIMSMAVDPRLKDTIYAASWTLGSRGGGVYRSTNAGHTWQLIGLEGHAVRAIAIAASNPDTMVAGATDGVYRSTDSGKTWDRISPEKHEDLRNFDSVAIDPHDSNTIYAGTYHLPWKTVDGGKTWGPIHQGMVDDSDVMSITVDQNNPSHLFASACSGIYHSGDGGASWAKFKGIPNDSRRTVHILQDPKRPQTVYAATTEGLWKTSDDGANWKLVTPASWSILSILIDPVNSDRLILGTERLGVQVSDNGGVTYSAANQGFSHRRIVDAALDPQHSERAIVVLTSNFEPMLETSDSGRSWTALAAGLKSGPPRHVFASPAGWFAAPGPGGLIRYDASKSSWVPVNQIVETTAPAHAGHAVAAKKISTGKSKSAAISASSTVVKSVVPFRAKVNDMTFGSDSWFAASDEGLFVSRDRGMNWTSLPFTPAQSMHASPMTNSTSGSTRNESAVRTVRLSAGNSYIWAVTPKQLEVSGDYGKTWISQALPFESRGALHLQITDDSTVVLAGDHGVFLSHDSGASWRQASLSELQIGDMAAINGNLVVAGNNGSLFLTRDKGKTWGPMDDPASDNSLSGLRARDNGNDLVVASATEGLFLVNLGSASSASVERDASSPAPKK